MISQQYDFDDQFFREVSISLRRTLNKQIRWINRFEDSNIRVIIPFYSSLATQDERFIFDAFVDDIADKRIMSNTDQFQRGVVTMTSIAPRSDEFANPNQYISHKTMIDKKIRKILSKTKAVPIAVNYDIEIQLATQNEVDKCSQKILNMLFNYYFFSFDYYGLKMDAVLTLPDDKSIEIPREVTMDSDRKNKIKFSLEIRTYYPIFNIDSDDLIPCDNDDDINWEYLGIPKPSTDYIESLKGYNLAHNIYTYNSDLSGNTNIEGVGEIKKVYWYNFYESLNSNYTIADRLKENFDPKQWQKEYFAKNTKNNE